MTRTDLQDLARTRLADARVLMRSRRYDGAYYLLGIAVECALKACIARRVRRYEFPNKDMAVQSYTHQLGVLVKVAGLEKALDADMAANQQFAANWLTVKDWSIESRYGSMGQAKAEALFAAVRSRQNGVMRWIRQRW